MKRCMRSDGDVRQDEEEHAERNMDGSDRLPESRKREKVRYLSSTS